MEYIRGDLFAFDTLKRGEEIGNPEQEIKNKYIPPLQKYFFGELD